MVIVSKSQSQPGRDTAAVVRLGGVFAALLTIPACALSDDAGGGETLPVGSDGSTSSGTGTVTGTTGGALDDEGTTTAMSTGEQDGSSDDGTPVGDGPVEPPPPLYCGLPDIDPTADITMVVDAGTEAGQLPVEIGDALVRNCGCHYTDNVEPPHVDYGSDTHPLATLADFHVPFAGTLPMGFEGEPVYVAVEERVVNGLPLPMPPLMCDVMGEDGVITEDDRLLFADWLAAGAPDAPTYAKGAGKR